MRVTLNVVSSYSILKHLKRVGYLEHSCFIKGGFFAQHPKLLLCSKKQINITSKIRFMNLESFILNEKTEDVSQKTRYFLET